MQRRTVLWGETPTDDLTKGPGDMSSYG